MFLTGKRALVTGSTSGIGLAIARALAAEGARVVLNGFGEASEIEKTRAGIEKEFGVKAIYSSSGGRMYGKRVCRSRHRRPAVWRLYPLRPRPKPCCELSQRRVHLCLRAQRAGRGRPMDLGRHSTRLGGRPPSADCASMTYGVRRRPGLLGVASVTRRLA